MAASTYRKDYLNERLQLWVDNLNLLYVAFTRAEKNLICWSKQGQKNTVADLLAHVLPDIAHEIGTWDEEDNCYTYGELCPSASKQQANPHSTETNRLTAPPAPLSVRMTALRPDIEFRQSNRSADFIAGVQDEESPYRYIDRGRLLHTLFSNIRTTADIDAAIDRLVFEGVIAETSTIEEIRELTHRAFSLPQVQEWYSGKWTLFSECNIIWMENGKLQTRRPDRVMTAPDGQVVVVDFKFGRPNQKYNKQVRSYIDLLVRMGYKRPLIEGYLWYVDESRIESV